jgi:hypothetical protein
VGRCNPALVRKQYDFHSGGQEKYIYRRYKRETTNIVIRCGCTRMLGHLLATAKKLENLWTCWGKNSIFFKEIGKTITDMV